MNLVKTVTGLTLGLAVAGTAMAGDLTRGFLIEQGAVAAKGAVSVDLQSDISSAGIRVGLGKAELALNSNHVGNTSGTDAILKFSLPALQAFPELKHSWSVYGGWSLLNDDATNTKYNNFSAGVALTAEVEKLAITFTPELVLDNAIDETYVNFGLAAAFDLGATQYGTFKPAVEVVASTLSGTDAIVGAGVRWGVNDRVTLDIIPVILGGADTLSLPGQLRLNARF